MKGDLHPAAFALLQRLPVRTVEARYVSYAKGQDRSPNPAKQYGSMGIRVKGVDYDSLSDARRRLGFAYKTLHKMVARGEAEYV